MLTLPRQLSGCVFLTILFVLESQFTILMESILPMIPRHSMDWTMIRVIRECLEITKHFHQLTSWP